MQAGGQAGRTDKRAGGILVPRVYGVYVSGKESEREREGRSTVGEVFERFAVTRQAMEMGEDKDRRSSVGSKQGEESRAGLSDSTSTTAAKQAQLKRGVNNANGNIM
ncbi:hypothetical protein Dda_3815 [Drechslerella dactyloides]|uniref:Uncharacterized protein n=1 Tax=Drechslerella dactyloides TaxID=74499 RepID=A0AAD6IYL4_DREDA|nr:hypothetical protein Dda_3815 [Drechslerella dactyloides]